MSRNQKATVLMSGMYAAAVVSGLIGGLMPSETRITGTIKSRTVNIPIWLQKEPEYAKLEGAKVSGGWMGGKIFMFVVGAGLAGVGLVLSSERQKELEKEAIEEAIALKLFEETAKLNAAAQATLTQQILTVQGQAKFSIAESQIIDDFNAIRESNGWLPPPTVVAAIAPTSAIASPVIDQLPPLRSPAEYAAEAKSGLKEKLAEPVKIGDEAAIASYRENAVKFLNSLASLQQSILSAAPTGAGKTHTMEKWLGDLFTRSPAADVWVIAQKNDDFCGLTKQGKVALFDPFDVETSLENLNKVYAILDERRYANQSERVKFRSQPVRLILDDWFATYQALRLNQKIWGTIALKLSAIITLGREFNVCLYICTQSYNLISLGLAEDSNIRANLAITCQGFVSIDSEGRRQGDYTVIQQLIKNDYIVPNQEDKQRLAGEVKVLIKASEVGQTPIIFSAIGEPMLGLMPHIQRNTNSNTVELLNDNPFKLTADDRTYEQKLWDMEFNLSGISAYPDMPEEDTSIDDIASSQPPDTSDTDTSDTSKPEWLPDRKTILGMATETSRCFSEFVKKELKSSRGDRYKTTREFVTKLIIESGDLVLINKFNLGE